MSKPCGFTDCERPVDARGFCAAHYMQHKRGSTLRPLTVPIADRAGQRVEDLVRWVVETYPDSITKAQAE